MQRKKKILLVSHCILNQNTVIEGEARALGAIPSAVDWIKEQGFGVVQLPCPEFTYLGLGRPPMTYEQYNHDAYRSHCKRILVPIIQSSPSCDQDRGVFMEELQQLFKEHSIPLEKKWYLPNTKEPVFDASEHYNRK
jgi:hypothetical protein